MPRNINTVRDFFLTPMSSDTDEYQLVSEIGFYFMCLLYHNQKLERPYCIDIKRLLELNNLVTTDIDTHRKEKNEKETVNHMMKILSIITYLMNRLPYYIRVVIINDDHKKGCYIEGSDIKFKYGGGKYSMG